MCASQNVQCVNYIMYVSRYCIAKWSLPQIMKEMVECTVTAMQQSAQKRMTGLHYTSRHPYIFFQSVNTDLIGRTSVFMLPYTAGNSAISDNFTKSICSLSRFCHSLYALYAKFNSFLGIGHTICHFHQLVSALDLAVSPHLLFTP